MPYLRIRSDVAGRIAAGEYGHAARLPSETELAQRYGVTRMTVRHAIDGLVDEGVVVRRQGLGTFVSKSGAVGRPLNRLSSFTEDLHRQGHTATAAVMSQEEVEPPDDVRTELGLDPEARTVRLERLRSVDGRPVSVAIAWIPLMLAPSLVREPMEGRSLYDVLERVYDLRPVRARQHITAVAADDRLHELLDVPTGSPLIAVQRLTFGERNEALELARSWTVPDIPLWIDLSK